MGKGKTKKDSPPVATGHTNDRSDAGGTVSPCAEPRSITILLTPGAVVAAGDHVTIVAGRPPSVRVRSGRVGDVATTDAADIEGCIAHGYRFTGTITDVTARPNAAVALIEGAKE